MSTLIIELHYGLLFLSSDFPFSFSLWREGSERERKLTSSSGSAVIHIQLCCNSAHLRSSGSLITRSAAAFLLQFVCENFTLQRFNHRYHRQQHRLHERKRFAFGLLTRHRRSAPATLTRVWHSLIFSKSESHYKIAFSSLFSWIVHAHTVFLGDGGWKDSYNTTL